MLWLLLSSLILQHLIFINADGYVRRKNLTSAYKIKTAKQFLWYL